MLFSICMSNSKKVLISVVGPTAVGKTEIAIRLAQELKPDIVLLDTRNNYQVIPIEKTRAWNFQQGTMFYWHPEKPETQFFFNDRDPTTQRVFTVLYDIERRERLREYRFDDILHQQCQQFR